MFFRNYLILLITFLNFILYCLCYPVDINQQKGLLVPPPEIMSFMKRFGYLDSSTTSTSNFDSEALYHEDAIVEAIKNIQKYGALNQTGILDNETLKLMITPRCGVADIDTTKSRTKRYVIGSKRWKKRNLTYFIANWSPQIGEDNVVRDMKKAFAVWAPYSNLKFKRIFNPSADIIIAFGTRYHGDNYPFDGPGNILAHAYYPYEMRSFGGDIHFDDDEYWKENSTNLSEGVDFFSVAVHELGHSLGLAHSPVYSSIMFPYYKGSGSYYLDFDDILAVYELYVKVPYENEFNEREYSTETTNTEDTTTKDTPNFSTTERQNNDRTTLSTMFSYEGDYETVDDHHRKNGMITTTSRTTSKNSEIIIYGTTVNPVIAIPDICEGNFDDVASLRGDVFIFKGEYVWKITDRYRISPGYPIKIVNLFPFLHEVTIKIDAIYERHTDNAIVIFYGRYFWVYDGQDLIENSPKSISYYGISENITKIDAAMSWPRNQRTYLFSGNQFWRYDDNYHLLDDDYPKSMKRWNGIPNDIDAATSVSSGRTYFFKGNLYWRFNNRRVRPERGYPKRSSNIWLGCPLS